jgi:hypothetical protein
MAKKPSPKKRGSAKGQSTAIEAHTKALKEHARALSGHAASMKSLTTALNQHSKALALAPPATASQLVYSCLADFGLKTPVPDSTKLSALGFDTAALAGLAGDINGRHWHGVHVDTGAVQACSTIADVIEVVSAAE